MKRMIDKKFFEFIGINVDEIKKRIKQIEEICGIGSVWGCSEEKLRYIYFQHLQNIYLRSMPELPIVEKVIRCVGNAYSYDKDIDTALYMLAGSWVSGWEVTGLTNNAYIPFSIIYNNSGETRSSVWCKAIQRLFGREDRISLIAPIDEKTRVGKYSYLNMRNLREEVKESIADIENQYQRMRNSDRLTLNEMESLKYHCFMSCDGIENYILLDWMLGLSFAEICCVHMSETVSYNKKYVEEIIKHLSMVKCCNLRNELADMILQDDLLKIANQNECEQFINSLECIVKIANSIYSVSLYQVWFKFKRNVGDDIEEIWQEIIMKNGYGVNIPMYDLYSYKLYSDICKEKALITMPEFLKDTQAVQEQISGIQMWNEFDKWIKYKKATPSGIEYTQIEEENEIRSKEDDKRGMFKNPKTLNEWYIKIQSIIISCQVVGNFPTFFK